MQDTQNTTPATLVDDSPTATPSPLPPVPETQNAPPVPVEASKTNLTAAAQASRAIIFSRIAQRCADFRTARKAESNTIHGPMVGDVADLFEIMLADGLQVANKAIKEFFASVWIDETEPSVDKHVKFGRGHKHVTISSASTVSRQYAQVWNDLGRWTAALRNTGALVDKVLRAGTERKGLKSKGERDYYAASIQPIGGVKISTKIYATPYDALMDGVGFYETRNAFRNILRPTYIDLSPFFTMKHNLEAATLQAVDHKIVLKVKDKAGVGRRKNIAISADKMLEVQTILGILAHLHHSGSLAGVRDKIAGALEAPGDLLTPAMEARFKEIAAEADEADGDDDTEDETGC